MRNLGISLVMFTCGLSLLAQQTVTCSSNGTRRQVCPADTSNGVVLSRELSNGVCQQGSTWSYSRQGITVSGGCSAEFQVSGNNGNANRNNGYGSGAYDNRNDANGNNYNNGNTNGNGNNYNNGNGNNYNNGNGGRGYRRGVAIPSGTQLEVRLEQAIRPTEVNQGETVSMSLVNDLSVNGRVIAPAGTSVQGKVNSERGQALDLRLNSMSVNGQNYLLSTNSVHSARDSQSTGNDTNPSTRNQLGSILGNIAGGGQLASGTVYTFRLTSQAQPSGGGQQ